MLTWIKRHVSYGREFLEAPIHIGVQKGQIEGPVFFNPFLVATMQKTMLRCLNQAGEKNLSGHSFYVYTGTGTSSAGCFFHPINYTIGSIIMTDNNMIGEFNVWIGWAHGAWFLQAGQLWNQHGIHAEDDLRI